MTRIFRFVAHNWPLKVAAIGLATLLYAGLVLSQTSRTIPVSIPISTVNGEASVIVLSNPGAVTRVRYVAPPDLDLRIDSTTFRATVDLKDVVATGAPVSFQVIVEAVDPRVTVLDAEPGEILLTLDNVGTKSVPVRPIVGPVPSGLDAGVPVVDVENAVVSGPESLVARVTEVQARVAIDASGIDLNQLVDLLPVDSSGEPLSPVDVEPAQARVRVPVFTDRRSKTLPVTPSVVGTPAAGFEVASVVVSPAAVSVEGDANDLAGLDRADTQPISLAGASSEFTQTVELALPDGVQALGTSSVQVTVTLRPVTGTRTFEAGLALTGARPDLLYSLSVDHVLVTIGGSIADLDRLLGANLVLSVDVAGLEPGTHSVAVSANLSTGLTLIGASPNPIEVTASTPAPPPSASPGPSATP
jgi:YbbR domain-containing protein